MTMQIKSKVGLAFGLPFSGKALDPHWALALRRLDLPMSCEVRWTPKWRLPVDVARTEIAEEAVKVGARWLFFLDEDVEPPTFAVKKLIYDLENHPDVTMVGGIYSHKSEPPHPMVFRQLGMGPSWDWKFGDVFPVEGIGLGCALIRVDHVPRIPTPWFKTEEWWPANITEDQWFCMNLMLGGFKLLADGGILPIHRDPKTGQAYQLPWDSCVFSRNGMRSPMHERRQP